MQEKLTVVVPCYNEAEALPIFYREILKIKQELGNTGLELLLVDDGSKDGTLSVAKELAAKDASVRYISFSRNFGKEAAIYAGLQNAEGDYIAVMDADLQDPPSLLPEMLQLVQGGEYDSVGTRRVTRAGEPPIRSFFARCFYKLMNKISQTELVDGARDFRLMNRKFVAAVLQLQEHIRFSKGLFALVGFLSKWLEYENVERAAGETKWSFWGLVVYAVEGMVAFSTLPLIISTVLGLACCCLAFAGTAFVVVKKILFGDPIQGWASTVCIILTLSGIQLFCTGILGQYLAKTYMESKRRPIYLINEKNF